MTSPYNSRDNCQIKGLVGGGLILVAVWFPKSCPVISRRRCFYCGRNFKGRWRRPRYGQS